MASLLNWLSSSLGKVPTALRSMDSSAMIFGSSKPLAGTPPAGACGSGPCSGGRTAGGPLRPPVHEPQAIHGRGPGVWCGPPQAGKGHRHRRGCVARRAGACRDPQGMPLEKEDGVLGTRGPTAWRCGLHRRDLPSLPVPDGVAAHRYVRHRCRRGRGGRRRRGPASVARSAGRNSPSAPFTPRFSPESITPGSGCRSAGLSADSPGIVRDR